MELTHTIIQCLMGALILFWLYAWHVVDQKRHKDEVKKNSSDQLVLKGIAGGGKLTEEQKDELLAFVKDGIKYKKDPKLVIRIRESKTGP